MTRRSVRWVDHVAADASKAAAAQLALEAIREAISAKIARELSRPRSATRHAREAMAALTGLIESLAALVEDGAAEDSEDDDLDVLLAAKYPRHVESAAVAAAVDEVDEW